MKQKIRIALLLMACPALLVPAQQKPPQIILVPVAGPVCMLEGGGGNIGVVADDAGLLMIDSMFEGVAAAVREAVKALPGGGHVRMLIDTHWHADHTDGNKAFGPGAVVIAHENVLPLVAKGQTLLGGQVEALPAGAQPNLTFSDRLTIYAGGESIRLVHFPHAHTDGDTVVFLDGQKTVHMGDMFFNGMFPVLDFENGGDIDNWVCQLDTVLASLPAEAKIIPGHGRLGGVVELKAFRDMLETSANFVREQMKAGKTLDEVKAMALPDSLEPWTKGFLSAPEWLEMVYRSLEKR